MTMKNCFMSKIYAVIHLTITNLSNQMLGDYRETTLPSLGSFCFNH